MAETRHEFWTKRLAELEVGIDVALTHIAQAEAARLGQLSLFATEARIIPFPPRRPVPDLAA